MEHIFDPRTWESHAFAPTLENHTPLSPGIREVETGSDMARWREENKVRGDRNSAFLV